MVITSTTTLLPYHLIKLLQFITTVVQIPQCTSSIPHNAPFYNRNVHVHIYVTEWIFVSCIVWFVRWVFLRPGTQIFKWLERDKE